MPHHDAADTADSDTASSDTAASDTAASDTAPDEGDKGGGSRPTTPAVLVEDTDASSDDTGEQVTSPTKLIRIASMVRTMLEEVRQAPLDEQGRRRLREIYERTMAELRGVLSDDLRDELDEMVLPFSADAPSESELRLAQAQLVGWLEGLFHGIQATLFQQQAAASQQLEEMRRRAALEAPAGPAGRGLPGTGQYL